jgi:hypothetical protein
VLGAGMGFLMQTTMLIAQNSVGPKDMGVASSAATFFRSIGGSFGVSLFGAVFNHALKSDITHQLGGAAANQLTSGGGVAGLTAAKLRLMPPELVRGLLHGIATATSSIFVWAIVVAVLVPVLAVFIKHVPLRGANDRVPTTEEATADLVAVSD